MDKLKMSHVKHKGYEMKLNKEQLEIMSHTSSRAAGGLYCGDSSDMQILVENGLMISAGRKSFVPDEYFRITKKGEEVLRFNLTKQ